MIDGAQLLDQGIARSEPLLEDGHAVDRGPFESKVAAGFLGVASE